MAFRRLTLSNKVGEYILEFLLVVGGISGSFWIENYREEVANRKLEQNYMVGLQEDLSRDSVTLGHFIGVQEARAAACLAVLGYSGRETYLVDSFARHFGPMINYERLNRNDNTLRALQGSADFRLLRNDSLRKGLLELDRAYLEVQRVQEHLLYDLYDHFFPDFFEGVDIELVLRVRTGQASQAERSRLAAQLRELLQNQHFRNLLFVIGANARSSLSVFQNNLIQTQAMLSLLKLELSN